MTLTNSYCIDTSAPYYNGHGSGGQGGGQDDSKEGGYETPNNGHNGGWSFYEGWKFINCKRFLINLYFKSMINHSIRFYWNPPGTVRDVWDCVLFDKVYVGIPRNIGQISQTLQNWTKSS